MNETEKEYKNEEDLLDDYFGTEDQEEKSEIEPTIEEKEEERTEDLDAYQDNFPKDKKVKRHTRAVKMVSEAKAFVSEADEHIESSKLLLESDLDTYVKAKQDLYDNGLTACISGLKKVGATVSPNLSKAKDATASNGHDTIKKMQIKGVFRSKFASFLYALVFGLLSALGFLYMATKALGMSEENTHRSLGENFDHIMTWFSTLIGMESMTIGMVVYLTSVVLVTYIAYLLRILYKSNSNLHFAAKQLAEAELFNEIQQDEKYKLDQIDTHVKECIALFEKYAVFCNEQQGTLQRILYVEGEKEDSSEYNRRSSREIQRTEMLVEHILALLSEPVAKESQLSQKSVHLLLDAREHLDKVIERLYRVRRDDTPRS
ncbi:MAG: hypothetical protein GQ531_03855 [Sulfurovum sp.]|nr:hypothetical protein [Sulfurovum sp.]